MTYVSASYWRLSVGNFLYKQMAIFVPWSLDDPPLGHHKNRTLSGWISSWMYLFGLDAILRKDTYSVERVYGHHFTVRWLPNAVCGYPQPAVSLSPILSVWDERCLRNKLKTLCLPSQVNMAAWFRDIQLNFRYGLSSDTETEEIR